MGRSILVAVLAAARALLAARQYGAQQSRRRRALRAAVVGTRAAAGDRALYGATYIPGVGFRYLAPGGPESMATGLRVPRSTATARARDYRRCRAGRDWCGLTAAGADGTEAA